MLCPHAEKLHKVTIIPRGRALGSTMFLPERDRYTYGREWMLDQLVVLYAGRVAEKMYTGDLSSGPAERVERNAVGEIVLRSRGLLALDEHHLNPVTGRFVLDDLPPGRHLVTTDHLAFEERTDSVTVFSEETVDIEVRMATKALEVEGLVVTARTRSLAGVRLPPKRSVASFSVSRSPPCQSPRSNPWITPRTT